MSQEKRIEQEINWYKVIFTILIATIISLLVWLAQNYNSNETFLLISCLLAMIASTIAVVLINIKVFKLLDTLEKL